MLSNEFTFSKRLLGFLFVLLGAVGFVAILLIDVFDIGRQGGIGPSQRIALGAMLLVIGYPIYYTINLSFHFTSPSLAMTENVWIGLDNYRTVLRDSSFRNATENTIVWTVFSTLFSFIIGTIAALVLNREFLGRGFLRGLLLIPYVISAVAASYIWRWILHSDYGVIGAATTELGLTDGPELTAAVNAVIETYGKSERNKYRAVVYYMLTKHFGKESVYR